MDPEQLPLRELHLPEAIGWWPLAPGWWVLIALAVLGLGYLMYKAFLKWRWNAARRMALRELARVRGEYESGLDAVTLATELSQLLRRTMLAYARRDEVAGLTGQRWLQWLDRGLADQPFASGPGQALESLPYRSRDQIGDDVDVDGLLKAVQERLRAPLTKGAL
jgi:hypothetical protein